jgi:hypothetical protein
MDIKIMYTRGGKDVIYAAEAEGTAWEDFDIFDIQKGTTMQKVNKVREMGYKIIIVPYENRIYDDIAGVVQFFDENGRGDIQGGEVTPV